MIKVRKHIRKTKRGSSVVRRHFRSPVRSLLKDLTEHSKANTKVNLSHKAKGSSLAHTDTVLDKGKSKPVENTVNIDVEKALKNGQSLDSVLAHEFGHILDRDKVKITSVKSSLSTSKKAQPLMKAIKNTKAFKLVSSDKYASKPEELFARAYAQFKTGKILELKTGLGWSKSEFKPIAKELKKLLKSRKS